MRIAWNRLHSLTEPPFMVKVRPCALDRERSGSAARSFLAGDRPALTSGEQLPEVRFRAFGWMKPISNHAIRAADDRDARWHSKEDLAEAIGAPLGTAWRIGIPFSSDEFVVQIVDIEHLDESSSDECWLRGWGVSEDEFYANVLLKVAKHPIRPGRHNGAIVVEDLDHPETIMTFSSTGFARWTRKQAWCELTHGHENYFYEDETYLYQVDMVVS